MPFDPTYKDQWSATKQIYLQLLQSGTLNIITITYVLDEKRKLEQLGERYYKQRHLQVLYLLSYHLSLPLISAIFHLAKLHTNGSFSEPPAVWTNQLPMRQLLVWFRRDV